MLRLPHIFVLGPPRSSFVWEENILPSPWPMASPSLGSGVFGAKDLVFGGLSNLESSLLLNLRCVKQLNVCGSTHKPYSVSRNCVKWSESQVPLDGF